ncbi:hypothetical protein CU098_013564 [Rhizopus stolonifer]|uniref:Uncharacterized protein n=1 Tax=Rhizopus stolonifer TaxID=4846 RepID=A0A367KUP8_RHIST|nr:hypothetical protein CU098_013564 [Rhizopus stolonifer]
MRVLRDTLVVSFARILFASYNKWKEELATTSIHVHRDTVISAVQRMSFQSFIAAKKPRPFEQQKRKGFARPATEECFERLVSNMRKIAPSQQ